VSWPGEFDSPMGAWHESDNSIRGNDKAMRERQRVYVFRDLLASRDVCSIANAPAIFIDRGAGLTEPA
jgi:hypothetical protein